MGNLRGEREGDQHKERNRVESESVGVPHLTCVNHLHRIHLMDIACKCGLLTGWVVPRGESQRQTDRQREEERASTESGPYVDTSY